MSDSVFGRIGGVIGQAESLTNSVGSLARTVGSLASGGGSGSWLDQLQPATWRGLPFAVRSSEYRRGRRFAVHEYPYRDVPWAEDVGRASRVVGFSGFVVGDDCYAQAQALLKASEQPGLGTLVHPSLGEMTVALIEPLVASERTELGRVVEIRFEFLESGKPIYPSNTTSTQSDVAAKAAATQTASASDFVASASAALSTGADAVHSAVATVQGFIGQSLSVVNGVRNVVGSVSGLGALAGPGLTLGRFDNAGPAGPLSAGSPALAALNAVSGIASDTSKFETGMSAALDQSVHLVNSVQTAASNLANVASKL